MSANLSAFTIASSSAQRSTGVIPSICRSRISKTADYLHPVGWRPLSEPIQRLNGCALVPVQLFHHRKPQGLNSSHRLPEKGQPWLRCVTDVAVSQWSPPFVIPWNGRCCCAMVALPSLPIAHCCARALNSVCAEPVPFALAGLEPHRGPRPYRTQGGIPCTVSTPSIEYRRFAEYSVPRTLASRNMTPTNLTNLIAPPSTIRRLPCWQGGS